MGGNNAGRTLLTEFGNPILFNTTPFATLRKGWKIPNWFCTYSVPWIRVEHVFLIRKSKFAMPHSSWFIFSHRSWQSETGIPYDFLCDLIVFVDCFHQARARVPQLPSGKTVWQKECISYNSEPFVICRDISEPIISPCPDLHSGLLISRTACVYRRNNCVWSYPCS